MYKIPLSEFIRLRSDHEFEIARKNFVTELNAVLDSYDKNVSEVDLRNIIECRQEIRGLLKKLFISCAVVAVGVHSFGSMCSTEMGSLDFWSHIGNAGIGLDTLTHHSSGSKTIWRFQ